MYDYIIIDPASPEYNRGSYCYLPYILYASLKEEGYKVKILEEFRCSDIDEVPEAKEYLVGLWSYPQIDAGFNLDRYLPVKPSFFGYYPLIDYYRLKKYKLSNWQIAKGIGNYYRYYDEFERILLSDCDMHLIKYEGQVYPLFTAYGCRNHCKFCPVSVNCDHSVIVSPLEEVYKALDYCGEKGYKNIHFIDEDFFLDSERAYAILKYTEDKGFNYIALGSVHTVLKFAELYGFDIFEQTGVRLVEIGLESADVDLNKIMGKKGMPKFFELAEKAKGKVNIFWLSISFFPGETLKTMRASGLFLEKYGWALEDLYGRIQTNSTIGGLGQFFQSYIGTPENEDIEKKGLMLSSRPVRLLPSFIPYSFLNSEIANIRLIKKEELKWYKIYRIDEKIFEDVLRFWNEGKVKVVSDLFFLLVEKYSYHDVVCFLGISARIGVIE